MLAYVLSIVSGDAMSVHVGFRAGTCAAVVWALTNVKKNGFGKVGFAMLSTERQCGSDALCAKYFFSQPGLSPCTLHFNEPQLDMFVITALYLSRIHESVEAAYRFGHQLLAHCSLKGSGSDEVSPLDLLCERTSCLHSLEYKLYLFYRVVSHRRIKTHVADCRHV